VSGLDTQMATLEGQLSSVADQKAKAVDKETALQPAVRRRHRRDDLQRCISASNQLYSDLTSTFPGSNSGQLASLQTEAAQVDQTCNQAESANQQLQSAIPSAP
jgi:hypothetical protein